MSDEEFRKLCNMYGFAPSRALRELLDCVRAQEISTCCTLLEGMHEVQMGNHNYYLHAANALRDLRGVK